MSETELIDIFDSDMNHVGVADKETAHSVGGDAPAGVIGWNGMMPDNPTQGEAPRRFHKSFHCWMIDSDGRVLLQRRSDSKKMFKRLFDVSAAGHYRAGESGVGGAREIEEELGFKPDVTRLAELCVFTDEYVTANYVNREFCYVYAYLSDTPLCGYVLSDETDGLASVGLDGLTQLFDGKTEKIDADYFDKHTKKTTRIEIGASDFVPSTSGYYAAVLPKLREWFNG